MKSFYLSFDDTDIEGSLGTGHILHGFLVETGVRFDFISRHQLYVHEDIPYTSHNSSMCAKITSMISEEDLIRKAGNYLTKHSPKGSDPGFCLMRLPCEHRIAELVVWGKRAKKQVLTKEDAYDLSKKYGIHLSEHGGTGQGVIGALAAVGLRICGNDGRVRGRKDLAAGEWSVAEFLEKTGFQKVAAIGEEQVPDTAIIRTNGEPIKAIVQNFCATVLTEKKNDRYEPLSRDMIKEIF